MSDAAEWPIKPKMVVLDGISGCGKSTLNHPVCQLSNYRDVVPLRFTPSCWVYNKLYGRPEVYYEDMNRAYQSQFELHVVWLRCDPEIALTRQIQKKDPMIEDLERAAELFLEYFQSVTALKNVHHVYTDSASIPQAVELIRRKVYPTL